MVELIRKVLKERYGITSNTITERRGGWASLAYKIEDDNGDFYFLKVYEKARKSTSYLTEQIDVYLPIVHWLENQSPLKGKMIRLVKNQANNFKFEDQNYVYILFDYIDGQTVGEQNLTKEQVQSLTEIVFNLHHLKDFPFDLEEISETFHLPFISKLNDWIDKDFDLLKVDIKKILKPELSMIQNRIAEWNHLSNVLRNQKLKFCLCHTDIHHWNIIADEQRLYLLDWEGIKFAPPEADIFSLSQQPYFDIFLKKYTEFNPDYQVNNTALQYYLLSRKLLDVFEFIEQLQFDELSPEEYEINLTYLEKEITTISA